jgi:hypothetical protein
VTKRNSDVAGAIYGQILVTSLVVVLSEDHSISAGEAFGAVLVTMIVFWLAHVYAETVAARYASRTKLARDEVRAIARQEWPMVEGAALSLTALALGWIGVFSRETAESVAIGLGIATLAGWGYLIARRSHLTVAGTVGAVAVAAAFGALLVGLKILVH